jgi:phospholipid-binding lipoprotein MlaA
MTSFNDQFFINVLNPVSKGYAYITHESIRVGISNFFENIMFPIRFSNNLLQLKFNNALEETERFVINSLWGLGGFLNPATNELDIKVHKEDFGQTLGFYGVGDGLPVVLPFLGQSNLRDMAGLGADSYLSALSTTGSSDINYKIPNNFAQEVGITSFNMINSTSLQLEQYETLKKNNVDIYPVLRDIYTKSRKKQIEE